MKSPENKNLHSQQNEEGFTGNDSGGRHAFAVQAVSRKKSFSSGKQILSGKNQAEKEKTENNFKFLKPIKPAAKINNPLAEPADLPLQKSETIPTSIEAPEITSSFSIEI